MITRAGRTAEILRCALVAAFADLGAMYTWRSWVSGWLLRVLAQVTFFALIGRLIGDHDVVVFLLVGNAVVLTGVVSLTVVSSTTWERRGGTLPLLVAAPGSLPLALFGRSLQWPVEGSVTALIALGIVGAAFDAGFTAGAFVAAVPLVVVIAATTYMFGTFLASFVLRAMDARNLVANVTTLGFMAICGVNVPVDFWPAPVAALARALPVTHGLEAVRRVLAGARLREVAGLVGLELVVGLAWLCVALASFERFARHGRRTGSIEFSD